MGKQGHSQHHLSRKIAEVPVPAEAASTSAREGILLRRHNIRNLPQTGSFPPLIPPRDPEEDHWPLPAISTRTASRTEASCRSVPAPTRTT